MCHFASSSWVQLTLSNLEGLQVSLSACVYLMCVKRSRDKAEKPGRLPVGQWPLSYLYGAELLVVCAGQAEAALLPVAPGAARAEAVRRRGQRGGTRARLVHHGDLHAVGLERLLVHKLVILRWEGSGDLDSAPNMPLIVSVQRIIYKRRQIIKRDP